MEQENQTQEINQQEQITISLYLTLEQVNFIINSLGKLPTETGAWIVRQIVSSQAQEQYDSINNKKDVSDTTIQ